MFIGHAGQGTAASARQAAHTAFMVGRQLAAFQPLCYLAAGVALSSFRSRTCLHKPSAVSAPVSEQAPSRRFFQAPVSLLHGRECCQPRLWLKKWLKKTAWLWLHSWHT